MTQDELMAIAFHEAGHGIALMAFGQPCTNLTVIPGEGYLGRCRHPPVPRLVFSTVREAKTLARQQIIGCYAGGEAEKLSGFVSPFGEDGSNQDNENAIAIANQYGVFPRGSDFPAYHNRLRAEARRLMRRHWAAVCEVARQLVEQETIKGDAVERIARPLLKKH